MKKVAFLVLAHTNPEQVLQLASKLKNEKTDIYIHFDKKYKGDVSCLGEYLIEKRNNVHYCGYSIVKSTICLIEAAMKSGIEYEYYMLLSGQCFPIRPLGWLFDRLNGDFDYINYYRMPKEISAKTLKRLEYFYLEGNSTVIRTTRFLLRFLPKRNFVKGMSMWPYAGSQWWCLRRQTINYIMSYVSKYPGYISYMKTTYIPDEVFFQSIISNMNIDDQIRPALFSAKFDSVSNKPYIITVDNIDQFVKENVFIARKFDSKVDDRIIDILSER